jgi:hypothetical protein
VSPSLHQKTETNPVSETLFSIYLEFRTMANVQKPSNSQCYTPSVERFRFYQAVTTITTLRGLLPNAYKPYEFKLSRDDKLLSVSKYLTHFLPTDLTRTIKFCLVMGGGEGESSSSNLSRDPVYTDCGFLQSRTRHYRRGVRCRSLHGILCSS